MTRSKRDANERAILDDLNRLGVWYHQMDRDAGFDLLLGFRGQLFVVEIKDPAQPESKRRLTQNERDTERTLADRQIDYWKCETLADVLRVLGAVYATYPRTSEQRRADAFTAEVLATQESDRP